MEKSSYFQNNGSNAGVLPSGYLQAATSAGQNIGNALNDIGSTINDAMTRHVANEQQRTVNMGMLNGYLGNPQNLDPNLVQSIDPKLIKKYQSGGLTLEDSKALLGTIASNQAMQQFKTQQAAAAQEAAMRANQISLGATAAQFAPTEAQQRINTGNQNLALGNQNLALGGQQLTAAQNQNKTAAAVSAANIAGNQAGQENVDPIKRLSNWINTVSANGGQISTQDLESKKAEYGVPKNVEVGVKSVFDEQGNFVGRSINYNGAPAEFVQNPMNSPAMQEKVIRLGNTTIYAPTTEEAKKFRDDLSVHKNMIQQADQIDQLIKDNGSKVGIPSTEAKAQMKTLIGGFRNNAISLLSSKRISPEVEKIITSMTGSPEDFFSINSNAQKQIRTIVNSNAEGLANTVGTYSNGAAKVDKNTFGWRQDGNTQSKGSQPSVRMFDTSGKEITNNQ